MHDVQRTHSYAWVRSACAAALLWLMTSSLSGCRDCSQPAEAERPTTRQCFTATSEHFDEQSPMRQVFEQAGRSGNGETWHAILRTELDARAQVNGPASEEDLNVGAEYSVTFQSRRTWIGFDPEAGGVLVCAGDPALLTLMRTTYENACRNPALLRKLIAQVPEDRWDD